MCLLLLIDCLQSIFFYCSSERERAIDALASIASDKEASRCIV